MKNKKIRPKQYNNTQLVPTNTQPAVTFSNDVISLAQKVSEDTVAKIKKGLDRPIASTGTPMSHLSGGAEFMAKLSNIGGGSLATGGGGVKDGFNTIVQNASANNLLKTASISDNSIMAKDDKT